MKRSLLAAGIAAIGLGATLTACNTENATTTTTGNIDAWLLTTTGELVAVDLDDPSSNLTFSRPSGLAAATSTTPAERLIDIDYRNADGALYGISDQNKIYLINPVLGTTSLISRLRNAANTADYDLDGSASYSMDFDPVSDSLRLIGSNGDNLSVDVASGQVSVGTSVAGGGAVITGSAYNDDFDASGRKAQLYTIDADRDLVYLQDPVTGAQSAPVALGVDATAVRGYDIDPVTGLGHAILTVAGKTRIYTIDPNAAGAAATPVGPKDFLPGDVVYRGIAVVTPSNPTVFGLSDDNKLYQFTARNPALVSNPASITLPVGAPAGETVLGLDFRPSDGKLYGLGSSGRIYRISADAATLGSASLVSTLSADAADTSSPYTGLSAASSYATDFSPVAPGGTADYPDQGRLRIIGSDQSNALAIIDNGAVTTQTAVTPASPTVAAAAYSNSYRGSLISSLYTVTGGNLAILNQTASSSAPEGGLTTVGALGITINGRAGLDIAGRSNDNVLLAARTTASGPLTLYRLALFGSSNLATAVDSIGGPSGPANLVDIAIRN